MAKLLAVNRRIPELEEDATASAGNAETDAPKSARKFLEERVFLRYRSFEEEPSWRKNVSSPWTRSRVAYTSGLYLRVSCGTSRCRRQGMETSEVGERQLGCWNGQRWWNRIKRSCYFSRVKIWVDRLQKLVV